MPRDTRQGGFTLLELIVVVAILGLVGRMVYVNVQGMIPEAVLDAERSKFAAALDQLRSESQINSKSYKLEIDLDNERWRYVLPPELKVASDQFVDDTVEANALEWSVFDEVIDLAGVGAIGNVILRSGLVEVIFDENGFSADQVFYFRHKQDENLVWSLIYRGLTGSTEYIESTDGVEYRPQEVTEGSF